MSTNLKGQLPPNTKEKILMKNKLKTFQLFVRDDEDSRKIADDFRKLFSTCASPLTESNDGDLIVAIGGDGTFLDAVSTTGFKKSKIFSGVNTGTLGFLQNISPEEFASFISFYSNQKELLTRKLYVPSITIILDNNETYNFNAINEIIVSGVHCGQISFSEYVEGELFQNVHADKIIVSSSTGDTAHSMNCNGAIDFSGNHQLVRTLDGAMKNSVYEKSLSNNIIATSLRYEFENRYRCEVVIDGIFKEFNSKVSVVEVSLHGDDYINKLELGTYSKVHTVRSKILNCED